MVEIILAWAFHLMAEYVIVQVNGVRVLLTLRTKNRSKGRKTVSLRALACFCSSLTSAKGAARWRSSMAHRRRVFTSCRVEPGCGRAGCDVATIRGHETKLPTRLRGRKWASRPESAFFRLLELGSREPTGMCQGAQEVAGQENVEVTLCLKRGLCRKQCPSRQLWRR